VLTGAGVQPNISSRHPWTYWYHLAHLEPHKSDHYLTIRPSATLLLFSIFWLGSTIWNNQLLIVHPVDNSNQLLPLAILAFSPQSDHSDRQPLLFTSLFCLLQCTRTPTLFEFSSSSVYLNCTSPLNGRRPKFWGVTSILDQSRCSCTQLPGCIPMNGVRHKIRIDAILFQEGPP
jgi:hypothetical protein